MKAKFKNYRLLMFLTIMLGIFVSSCNKEEAVMAPESGYPSGIDLKSVAQPAPNDMICDLVAGQNINVGKVVYSDDGEKLLVEYITTDGWMLSEVHLYVGNMENFKETCMNKTAVQIGKFPYSATEINDVSASFEILLADIEAENDGSYLVVAHAVVYNGDQEETGFANCTYQPIITTVKARFLSESGADVFGESEGVPFIADPEYWCSWLGTNEIGEDATYKIRDRWNEYGKVNVFEDGGELKIEIIPNDGFTLLQSWVYVGTLNGLLSYLGDAYDGVCPEYWRFPFYNGTQADSHLYTVPIPEPVQSSISFEQAFNSSRWGWISYYNVN